MKATNTGNNFAMFQLGNFYSKQENEAEDLKWLKKAASAGEVHAKQRLEMLFN